MCGRISLIRDDSRNTARTSRSGEISRWSSGSVSMRTPRPAATWAIDSSPCPIVPATSVVSYPRSASPAERYATCRAGPPMFRRAMTLRTLIGSAKQRVRRQLEPGLEVDGRLEPEHLAGGGDVGPRVADVPCAWRRRDPLDLRVEDPLDRS